MFVRGRGSQGVVLILSVVLSAMLAMPVLMAYADADAAGRGTWANAEDETFADVGSRDEGGLEASDEPGQSDVEGEQGQTGQIEDPANPEVPEGSQDLTGPADDPANDPADPADDSAGSAGSTDDPADPAGPAGDPAGPAASPSLPENDSPDGSAYRGATLRRTPLYASPDASQPEADFLWGGVVVGGFTRWDAAGEWLAVAYGGGRYFARASDVSLNDGSGSRVAVTLSRTPAYEAPDASLPEAEFFWGGVSLSASAWDAAGEWLAVPYRGATYFVRSDALSSADSPDGSAYRGATLRRTPLYASPDASQPEADFLWGGVVVGGFTRWDAAGEWLAVAYGGGRYFARASDVSLNDGSGSRVAVTLSRTPAYEAPDASLPEAEFFWGGVSLSASAWDAAGEWLAVPYRGATYFVRSDALSSADSPDGSAYRGATLRRTPLYASPDASQPEADFLWGGVVVGGFTRWDAAGEWLAVAYGGGRYFARASDVSLNDGSGSRVAVTLSRTPAYEAPDASLPEAEFFWGGVSLSASAWDAAGEWLAVPYRGATYFVRSDALSSADSPDGSAYRGATLRRTPLYASPDASQPEADFLWGGVVVGGFTRWDAAGEWLAVAYGGGRYFARASDVSLNDGSGSRVAVTLSRTPAYEAPDASLPEAEFFWGGVSLSASAWDAAGEWLAVPYRGATYFVRSDALSSADSPDGSAYRGATLRRTPLYASPDASQPEADFLWGGVVVGGFTRWDAAGEWLAVAYGGGRYFARASDVSLNDGSGSRVAVTLSRTPAYEAPDASLPEAEFFWGGVSLSASAWDAAGEWLAVPYRGATYFVRSDALSSADSPDGSAYRGATLRRTPLYASPDASQPEADFLWGGVVVGGFTRWDAAGEWLAVAYGGGRYFARASDVSLNDAPGRDVPYVGRTLGRVSMRPSPDLSSEPFDFFWGGVEVPAAPWDAAGEWVLSSYRGQAAFLPADSVELVPRYYRQEGTAMYLDIEWAGQPNGYYCGPASGYMVLNHLGAHTSESGVSLTMDNLAGYMGVDSSGTDSTGFLNALNNWLGRYDYQLIASPAYDQVHSAVMDAFSTGYPTVVHTYERRGGPHYNGHGNSSMGHFMVVDGYDTATDAVYIADPWAGVWSASSQKFWYPSLREFTATYITPYRYVYFH